MGLRPARPRGQRAPGSGTTTYHYDGLTVRVTDANQHVTEYNLNAFGQVVQTREYTGTYPGHSLYATTHYGYDPLGSLTRITDAGSNVTSITYDGLGRKIFLDDPDMGLVHLGDGRWYDPSLGRPLQPNPIGGPPSVPQALNRYAATSLGQPGVAQGAASTPIFWANVALAAVGNAPGAVVSDLGRVTAQPVIKGTKTALKTAQGNPTVRTILGDEVAAEIRATSRKTLTQLGVERGHAFTFVGESRLARPGETIEFLSGNFDRATLEWVEHTRGWRGFLVKYDLPLGIGIDVAVEAIFQANAPFWSNPYLSGWQKAGQFGLNLTAAGFASASTYLIVAAIGVSGPVGILVTIAVGTGASLFYGGAAHAIIEGSGLSQENRRLQPLGGVP